MTLHWPLWITLMYLMASRDSLNAIDIRNDSVRLTVIIFYWTDCHLFCTCVLMFSTFCHHFPFSLFIALSLILVHIQQQLRRSTFFYFFYSVSSSSLNWQYKFCKNANLFELFFTFIFYFSDFWRQILLEWCNFDFFFFINLSTCSRNLWKPYWKHNLLCSITRVL